jgi:hypothetical protein
VYNFIGAKAVLHSFMPCFPSQALYGISLAAGSMCPALDQNALLASCFLGNMSFTRLLEALMLTQLSRTAFMARVMNLPSGGLFSLISPHLLSSPFISALIA